MKDSCPTELTTKRSTMIREEQNTMRESNQGKGNKSVNFKSLIDFSDKMKNNF